jgi:hypothetical protein
LQKDGKAITLAFHLVWNYRGALAKRGVSARQATGLDNWLATLTTEAASPSPPQVDYDLYAEGEALLGWLNVDIGISSAAPFDGNRLLLDIAQHTFAAHFPPNQSKLRTSR